MSSCVTSAGSDDRRKSKYPMISVEDAVRIVLEHSKNLEIVQVPLMESCGRIVAEDVRANDPFPTFRASIMDGYAVFGPLEPGIYPVQERIHAGDATEDTELKAGFVAYITTGAMVPEGANAVVKVEDTNGVAKTGDPSGKNRSSKDETQVEIKVRVEPGGNIRQIGSDIQAGETILSRGQKIGPAEVGLLATVGVVSVPCYALPVVGILSTGSELVNPWETPVGSQIRDSNRASLICAFRQDGLACVDLGIVCDSTGELESTLLNAAARCDIVVTSGGVSMGEADLVKPMLEKLGTVHFGRLNMKPGKPTTFATLRRSGADAGTDSTTDTLFFGLPGNPVSCLVTKALLIDPALKKMQGVSSAACMPAQIRVQTETPLTLDPERPEYHRAILSSDAATGGSLKARSTGNQRSSRLLSMSSSNALLCLPQGSGSIGSGMYVTALLTGPLPSPPASICVHKSAAAIDLPPPSSTSLLSSSSTTAGAVAPKEQAKKSENKKLLMRVGFLTISDRASEGIYADESGPEMQRMLLSMAVTTPNWPLDTQIAKSSIVPDEPGLIRSKIIEWADTEGLNLILTSGGTGFGLRDNTPETVRPLLHREAPGVAQALLSEGLKHTPLAVLSRPVVGTRNNCLICTLPGSVKAVRENIVALAPLLPRIMELLLTDNCSHP